ncbi:MAG TPA: thioredoxin family protein [Actinomycetota bacterium]
MAKVEIFTAGCPVCDQGVQLVREVAGEGHEVIVHYLRQDERAAERASSYGVRTVPAVVVDGSLLGLLPEHRSEARRPESCPDVTSGKAS